MKRGLSRPDLNVRLATTEIRKKGYTHHEDVDDDRRVKRLSSETWLKHIESGQVAKLYRQEIDALIGALGCIPSEQAELLLASDRSPFSGDLHSSYPVVLNMIYEVMVLLGENTHHLADFNMQLPSDELSSFAKLEIVINLLRLMQKELKMRECC